MIKAPDFKNPTDEQLLDLEGDVEFLEHAAALLESHGEFDEARSVRAELSVVRMRKNRMKHLVKKKNAEAATSTTQKSNVIPLSLYQK